MIAKIGVFFCHRFFQWRNWFPPQQSSDTTPDCGGHRSLWRQWAGMSGLAPNWVRLAPIGTYLGLFKISFNTFGSERKNVLKRILKIPDLSHSWPIWTNIEPTLTSLVSEFTRDTQKLDFFYMAKHSRFLRQHQEIKTITFHNKLEHQPTAIETFAIWTKKDG